MYNVHAKSQCTTINVITALQCTLVFCNSGWKKKMLCTKSHSYYIMVSTSLSW